MDLKDRIILALDVDNIEDAERLVRDTRDYVGLYKIGMELFYSSGAEAVRRINALGGEIFLDLKLHDIPNTVRKAGRVLASSGVFMFNLHASGGVEMMRAAREGIEELYSEMGRRKPLIIGVTVLTSINGWRLSRIGVCSGVEEQVIRLSALVKEAGLDGIVCSPLEVRAIKERYGEDFLTVTPGVRPMWADKGDQKRVMTPAEAIRAGSDYLVIGRAVTDGGNPSRNAARILEDIMKDTVQGEDRAKIL